MINGFIMSGQSSNEMSAYSLRDPNTNVRKKIAEAAQYYNGIEDENENGNKENFKRWKRFWECRLTEEGKFYNIMDEAFKFNPNNGCPEYVVVNNCETQGNTNIPSDWKSIGTLPNGKQKQGKVCAIWSNPIDANNILIGTNGSGLWKTTNNGASWTNLTDVLKLPGMGVSSIVVKSNDPNTIWISTAAMFWNYGFGVFKTTNGGASWCYQPLADNNPWPFATDRNVFKIVIDPTNNNRLACISDKALYATIDGGTTWKRKFFIPDATNSLVADGAIDLRDLEIDPSQTDRLYISTVVNMQMGVWGLAGNQTQQCKLYKIENIWGSVSSNIAPTSTDLTPNIILQSPNVNSILQQRITAKIRSNGEIVASCGTGGFFIKSSDNGTTWSKIINTPIPSNWAGGLGYFLSSLAFDPLDVDHYYLGGTELVEVKIVNGSLQYIANPNGYQYFSDVNPNTHADIIELKIANGTLYVGCDGGIFSGNVNTPIWQTRNGDLSTAHVNGLGTNKSNGSIVGAAQDNQASIKNTKGEWNTTNSYGDGYEAEYETDRRVSDQGFVMGNIGVIGRFVNDIANDQGFIGITGEIRVNAIQTTEEGNFGALYTFDNSTIKRADNQTKTNGADIADFTATPTKKFTDYRVKDSKPTFIFAGINNAGVFGIIKTLNGTFTGTETSLFTFPNPINSIAIDNSKHTTVTNANDRLWVGLSDIVSVTDALDNIDPTKVGKNRVFFSDDGGVTFTDVSKGLGVFPIIKLVFDEQSKYLYAGTDAGVFVLNTAIPVANQEWVCFSNGLPPTIITDMDINKCTNKLIVSTQGRGIWETTLPWSNHYTDESDNANTEVLTGSGAVTWSTSKNIAKTIIVKAGFQLRIKGTVANPITINMGYRRAIVIEKGASLVVENATITNECGKMWTGIRVDGDASLAQCGMPTTMTNATANCANQGVVWLKNATVSNAVIGIGTGNLYYNQNDDWPQYSNFGGGIIIAENATFLNNRKAIEFMSYHKFWNVSRFLNCTFKADDYLPNYPYGLNSGWGQEFVTAWDVKRVKFDHCTFTNALSATYQELVDYYPSAIFAWDARLDITNNTFNNIRDGIGMNYSPLSTLYPIITNNTFTNTWRGIYVAGCMQPHSILSNTISIINNDDFVSPCATSTGLNEAFGIYDDNSIGIEIRENSINYSPDYNAHVNDRNYGIIFHNSGACSDKSGRVRRNKINDFNFGITSMGNNKRVQISCNQFTNTVQGAAELVNLYSSNSQDANCIALQNGYLESPQGSCITTTSPAGNQFADCSLGINRFLTDPVVNQIKYSEHSNASYRVEDCMTGDVVPIPCTYSCPVFLDCCPLDVINPWPPKDKEVVKADIAAYKMQKDTKKDLIDGGNTANLLDMVNNPINTSAYLLAEMLDMGNYISDAVLIATIVKSSNGFSNYELTQLITANSPVTEAVYNQLDVARPIVANNYNVWMAQQTGLSDRDVLEGEIQQLHSLEDRELQQLVLRYIDEGNADEAIINLLLNGYKEQALPLLVDKQDYTTAQNLISTLVDADLQMVYNMDLNYRIAGQTIKSITEVDKATLTTLATKGTTAGIFARNMLSIGSQKPVVKIMPPMPLPNGSRKKQRVLNYEKFVPTTNYVVYPNPSKGSITVVSYFGSFGNNAQIIITDVAGRVVYKANLAEAKTKELVPISNIAIGTYLLTITQNNKQVYQTKHQISE
jgi:Secretion system C-terminal sorting domain